MKPTTSYPASCAIAATIENTLKRTTTYLECGTYWLQDLWKIVCTLKQKKTQKIMAYHVIMHCDMDISEKKYLSAAFLKSSLLSTMTLSQKYSATSWKRSSISLPAPKSFEFIPLWPTFIVAKWKTTKNKTKNYEKNLPYSLPTIKEKTTTNHALYYDRKCFLLSYNLWILKTKTKKIHPRKTRQRWTRNKLKAPS